MSNNGNGKNGWRTQPMYSFSEVAHLSGVSVSTVRNWLRGYTTQQGRVEPLFQQYDTEEKYCSFLQLVEIVVAAKFRKAEHTAFHTIRYAYDNARKIYKLEYPFASLELKAIGGHIVHIIHIPNIGLRALDQPEQYTIPNLVQEAIAQLEYEGELAKKWWPVGKEVPIVVDPLISAGLPIVEGRGVTVGAIRKRFLANQKIAFIAKDFGLKRDVIEQVIRYAELVAV